MLLFHKRLDGIHITKREIISTFSLILWSSYMCDYLCIWYHSISWKLEQYGMCKWVSWGIKMQTFSLSSNHSNLSIWIRSSSSFFGWPGLPFLFFFRSSQSHHSLREQDLRTFLKRLGCANTNAQDASQLVSGYF